MTHCPVCGTADDGSMNGWIHRAQAAETKLEEFEQSFDLYDKAIKSLTIVYKKTHPNFPSNTLPDTSTVCDWAAEKITKMTKIREGLQENILTGQLLDLITLMPDSQTQEIVDYIMSLRETRKKMNK